MSFGNLKKNDVLFCESKGSRVVKLVENVNNVWIGRDMFSNQSVEITNHDTFKIVNNQRKSKPLSMVSLLESTDSVRPTLTEKEVFIVEYFQDNFTSDQLNKIRVNYYDGGYLKKSVIEGLNSLKRYLNIISRVSDDVFIQYALCAYDNLGEEITTSTPISRFKEYSFTMVEERKQWEYTTWGIDFWAEYDNQELLDEFVETMQDDFWNHSPDSLDTDYGDSETMGMSDPELTPLHRSKPFIIE